jgi:hypothetical protein
MREQPEPSDTSLYSVQFPLKRKVLHVCQGRTLGDSDKSTRCVKGERHIAGFRVLRKDVEDAARYVPGRTPIEVRLIVETT